MQLLNKCPVCGGKLYVDNLNLERPYQRVKKSIMGQWSVLASDVKMKIFTRTMTGILLNLTPLKAL